VSRRRRAALLLGLALVLGALAGSDVARREAALRAEVGPAMPVVVARRPLVAGRRVRAEDLAVRRIPARYVVAGTAAAPELLIGGRLAAPVPAGGAVTPEHLAVPGGASVLRPGQRAAEVVAAAGWVGMESVVPGARVDVLITRDRADAAADGGGAELALQDVEVLAARPARDDGGSGRTPSGPLVAATLRVGVRQAVFLAAAQSFAREIRLLARAPGDRSRAGATVVGPDLR
jgi:pilus assembly protein CpaB